MSSYLEKISTRVYSDRGLWCQKSCTSRGGRQVDELFGKAVGDEAYDHSNRDHRKYLAIGFGHGKVPVGSFTHQLQGLAQSGIA